MINVDGSPTIPGRSPTVTYDLNSVVPGRPLYCWVNIAFNRFEHCGPLRLSGRILQEIHFRASSQEPCQLVLQWREAVPSSIKSIRDSSWTCYVVHGDLHCKIHHAECTFPVVNGLFFVYAPHPDDWDRYSPRFQFRVCKG